MDGIKKLGGNPKMVLGFEMFGMSVLRVEIILIDKNRVKKIETPNDFKFYQDDINRFVIWSSDEFLFDKRQIRIPDSNHVFSKMGHTFVFTSENERRNTLKMMYDSLQRWSEFVDSRDKSNKKINGKRVTMVDNHWYVS